MNERFMSGFEKVALWKAHDIQQPGMITAAKPIRQSRIKSCVACGNAHREAYIYMENVGRNASERKDSPKIDRGWCSRPYLFFSGDPVVGVRFLCPTNQVTGA